MNLNTTCGREHHTSYLVKFSFQIHFFNYREMTVWRRVEKSVEARCLLQDPTSENLETFVIKFIYNDSVSSTLVGMRKKKWWRTKKKNKKTLARLGPDKVSNEWRTKRVIYQIHVMESFQSSEEPGSPLDHGYKLDDGFCVPITNTDLALPESLVDICDRNGTENNDNNSEPDDTASDSDEFSEMSSDDTDIDY